MFNRWCDERAKDGSFGIVLAGGCMGGTIIGLLLMEGYFIATGRGWVW
jgi:hypothetical protein